MFASGISGQLERVRPMDDILRSAAPVDPGVAELRADLQLRQRRDAMHRLLRVDLAWTPDRYTDWLSDTLTRTLLPD